MARDYALASFSIRWSKELALLYACVIQKRIFKNGQQIHHCSVTADHLDCTIFEKEYLKNKLAIWEFFHARACGRWTGIQGGVSCWQGSELNTRARQSCFSTLDICMFLWGGSQCKMHFFLWLTIRDAKSQGNSDNLDGEVGQQDLTITFLISSGRYGVYETGDIYFQGSVATF